jgi:hypothetical protein
MVLARPSAARRRRRKRRLPQRHRDTEVKEEARVGRVLHGLKDYMGNSIY